MSAEREKAEQARAAARRAADIQTETNKRTGSMYVFVFVSVSLNGVIAGFPPPQKTVSPPPPLPFRSGSTFQSFHPGVEKKEPPPPFGFGGNDFQGESYPALLFRREW